MKPSKRPVARHLSVEQLEHRLALSGVPRLVRDIMPGTAGSYFSYDRAAVNDILFFGVNDGVHGTELWKSDGTAEGTVLVKDIYPGSSSSAPTALFAYDGALFFRADDGIHGQELWKSNGTEAGTVLVRDFRPGPADGSPGHFANVGGTLFFNAAGLWKINGAENNPVAVSSIGGIWLTDVNGTVYFLSSNAATGAELWKSDGTEAGTVMVKDIRPGPSFSSPLGLVNVDGTLFFTADDGLGGRELWKSDGTEEGTVLVKDLYPWGGSNPDFLTAVNGKLFFSASYVLNSSVYIRPTLWKSDGTPEGTVIVKEQLNPLHDPSYLTKVDDLLFFIADDGDLGASLWKSDGTPDGTVLVTLLRGDFFGPDFQLSINGTYFFRMSGASSFPLLWKTDGTEPIPVLVSNAQPANGPSYPFRLTNVNGSLYFVAHDAVHGYELWALSPGPGDFDRDHYVNVDDIDLLFGAIGAGTHDPRFDLTHDGLVNHDDLANLVTNVLRRRFGDANLDGKVDHVDLATLVGNLGRSDSPSWSDGNFDGDSRVALSDLAILQENLRFYFIPPSSAAAAVVADFARNEQLALRVGPRIAATRSEARTTRATAEIPAARTPGAISTLRSSRTSRPDNAQAVSESTTSRMQFVIGTAQAQR